MLFFEEDIEVDQYGLAIDPSGKDDLISKGSMFSSFERTSIETRSVESTYSTTIVLISSPCFTAAYFSTPQPLRGRRCIAPKILLFMSG